MKAFACCGQANENHLDVCNTQLINNCEFHLSASRFLSPEMCCSRYAATAKHEFAVKHNTYADACREGTNLVTQVAAKVGACNVDDPGGNGKGGRSASVQPELSGQVHRQPR